MSEETKNKLEYYAKNTGYYTAKTINNPAVQWSLVAAATISLPYMAFINVTYESEADTTGTTMQAERFAQLSSEHGSLLAKIAKYNEFKKKQSAYEQLGDRDAAIEIANDILKTKYEANDLAKEFLVHALTSGSKQEGIDISEVEFKELSDSILDTDFKFDEDIQLALKQASTYAESIDEARALVSVPKVKDIKVLFDAAQNIASSAKKIDEKKTDSAVLSILLAVPLFFLSILTLGNIEQKTKHIRKPQKPRKKPRFGEH